MSNPPDIGTAEEEKKTNDLLALLYPEDGAQVDADLYVDDEELAGMRSLRALFSEAPDQEPSDALSNKLMALAAQHAPAARSESRGLFAWFSDLLMPLVAHPGLAAAATLVLLVGVAGTLYVKGGAKVAEPTAASRGEDPQSAASANEALEQAAPDPASTAPVVALDEEALGDEVSDDGLNDELASEGRKLERSSADRNELSKEAEKSRKAKPADIGGVLGGSVRGKGAKTLSPESNSNHFEFGDAPTGGSDTSKSDDRKGGLKVKDIDTRDFSSAKAQSVGTTSSENKKVPSAEPAPPPPAQKRPAPAKPAPTRANAPEPVADEDATDDGASESEEVAREADKSSNAAQAAKLHGLARTAAKKDDCARVKTLGQQIRKLDSAYYDRSFLSDASLKSCLQAATPKSTISK